MPRPGPPSLAHVLFEHAQTRGDQVAYENVGDDGRVDTLTYAELSARAAAAAEKLRGEGPVLLLYPPGLDFVVAIWACFLAGTPAVPAYPPLFGPADRVTRRFARVLSDSRAGTLAADPAVLAALTAAGAPGELPRVVSLDAGERTAAVPDTLPGPDSVALVQYTSGSTSQPKGVVLEHRNVLANVRAISRLFGLDGSTRAVSWLPPYHDMGLIGFILTPVCGGFPVRLMSPVHFLRRPLDWLRQISELGATHTGGPNFAYDLCVRRARGADLSGLELSRWRVAFNGAEPIRPRTLTAFADRFADNGFRAEAFLPCYGLAEATLIVSGRLWSPADGVDGQGRVDCGPVIDDHELVVVDPRTGGAVEEGVEGEIAVAGPSISSGYWNDAHAPDGPPPLTVAGRRYLRTGDLGYLRDGHLFVTGRIKDVLIQQGVNHHAHDVEVAAVDGDPDLRPTAAAFMVEGDVPELVIAVETARADVDTDTVAARVRERVLAATGARLDTVVLCPARTVPRTTSGKVQRALTRSHYLSGELAGRVVGGSAPDAGGDAAAPVERFLAGVFAAVCEVPECAPTQELGAIGGDSVRAAEIAAVTEDALALPVPVDTVLTARSPRALTGRLLADWTRAGVPESQVVARIGAVTAATGPAAD